MRNVLPPPYLVLVLWAVWVVFFQRGELTALGAGLGAWIQLTQLQKVSIFCHILIGQMRNHHSLLQVAAALWDWTADVRFGHAHLGNVISRWCKPYRRLNYCRKSWLTVTTTLIVQVEGCSEFLWCWGRLSSSNSHRIFSHSFWEMLIDWQTFRELYGETHFKNIYKYTGYIFYLTSDKSN